MNNAGSSGEEISYISDRYRPKNAPPIKRHRFQKSGHKEVYETKDMEDAFVMRVDMPGCPVSSFLYRIEEGRSVHFSAQEPDMPEYDFEGRKYEGTLVCNPAAFEVNEAKAELVDGVMWLTVPKIPREKEPVYYIVEKIREVKITSDMFRV